MKKFVAVFIGLCAALFIACNEDAAPATSAPTETIIDTLYVKVTDTVVNTVVLDSIDTLVIRNYKDTIVRDTVFVEPDFKSSENDSTTIVSFGNTSVEINKVMCGNVAYNPTKSFCYEGKLMDVCEGYAYNPKKFFCYEDSLIALCGGETYDPTEKYCIDGKYVVKGGYFTDERDGQTYRYVVIGNQTWMAENLKYVYNLPTATLDSSSICYDNEPSYCEAFGRYYLWSAAMDSAGLFSEDGLGCGDSVACDKTGHIRGVCPEGWHLPDTTEWRTLVAPFADSIKKEGEYIYYYDLSSNLLDSNNFPINAGGGYYATKKSYFGPLHYVDIWSSTQYAEKLENAYFFVFYEHSLASTALNNAINHIEHHWRSVERPVRCIKDEPF